MKIVRLTASGFKRLVAVDITPDGGVVEVRGNNGEGKTSLLDSIMAVLGGSDAAPVKPIRTGEDFAAIRVELGDDQPALIVTKYFDEVGEKLRVETADGAEFKAGQSKVNELLGRLSFDPLAFKALKPVEQAAELRRLVTLTHEVDGETVPLDLDKLAEDDKADIAARRDVNRDAKALRARLDGMPVEADLPEERPDLDALTTTLVNAANTNAAIQREADRRTGVLVDANHTRNTAASAREEAARLRVEADRLEAQATQHEQREATLRKELTDLPALDEPIDTAAAREAIDAARIVSAKLDRHEYRETLVAEFDALKVKSAGFTESLERRAKLRADALAAADMPIAGLSLADVEGEMVVTFNGEPFSQSSGAEQLRVSMALAMAANPKLRVMLIRDGSLLDKKGMALIREMAIKGNYQCWVESVGDEGTGIIMEAGAVRGAPEPERIEPPKRRRKIEGEVEVKAAEEIKAGEPVHLNAKGEAEPTPAARDARTKPRALSEFSSPPATLFGDD